jgi:phosphoribosyl 1,2-cyclic phosphodiesterase
MMKYLLSVFLLLISGIGYSQKYVLIDKRITSPVSYTDAVTLEHSHKNLFPVENSQVKRFISELEKITEFLTDPKKPKPQAFDYNIGKTRFVGLKVSLLKEERLDVVISTDCEGIKIFMHVSDSKNSNARNAYFINTWIKYIKSSVK